MNRCPHCGYLLGATNDARGEALVQLRGIAARMALAVGADDTVDAVAAAALLCRAPSTLNGWRTQGIGPAFTHRGRRTRYALADLAMFIASERADPFAR